MLGVKNLMRPHTVSENGLRGDDPRKSARNPMRFIQHVSQEIVPLLQKVYQTSKSYLLILCPLESS